MANNHKCCDANGNHIIGGSLTGWIFTDAARQVKCPRCGSDRGYRCERPAGTVASSPHTERLQAFTKLKEGE